MLRADCCNSFIRCDEEYHRVDEDLDLFFVFDKLGAAVSIARACQFFFEMVETEAVMDALLQDTAHFAVALDDEDLFRAVFVGAVCCRQTSRAAADDNDIIKCVLHLTRPPHWQNFFRRTGESSQVLCVQPIQGY